MEATGTEFDSEIQVQVRNCGEEAYSLRAVAGSPQLFATREEDVILPVWGWVG